MREENQLRLEEVSVLIGNSSATIDAWYRWKRKNPNHVLAELLPEPEKIGVTRYWNKEDIWKLLQFKASIPHGRNGVMGDNTNRSYRKKGTITDEKS